LYHSKYRVREIIEYRFKVPSTSVFTLYSYSKALEYHFKVPTAASLRGGRVWGRATAAGRTTRFGGVEDFVRARGWRGLPMKYWMDGRWGIALVPPESWWIGFWIALKHTIIRQTNTIVWSFWQCIIDSRSLFHYSFVDVNHSAGNLPGYCYISLHTYQVTVHITLASGSTSVVNFFLSKFA
jgi:hypothetical protein